MMISDSGLLFWATLYKKVITSYSIYIIRKAHLAVRRTWHRMFEATSFPLFLSFIHSFIIIIINNNLICSVPSYKNNTYVTIVHK